MDNTLTDIPWILIEGGHKMTVRDVLVNAENLSLDTAPAGFIYGSQLRFLMTITPLLCRENPNSPFAPDTVDRVLESIGPAARLFNRKDPFLQVAPSGTEKWSPPQKLYPTGIADAQNDFWSFDAEPKQPMNLAEATRALVIAYFYMPGTNTNLSGGKSQSHNKLSNASSALRYVDSSKGGGQATEIIALGKSLADTLLFNTPRAYLQTGQDGDLLPHWADRRGESSKIDTGEVTPLWKFSWSGNTFCCLWDESGQSLTGVTRGGVPDSWLSLIPRPADESWPGKGFHDQRSTEDPLYFYVYRADGKEMKTKLRLLGIATDPYFTVAQWNAEKLSVELTAKWQGMLRDPGVEGLKNILFISYEIGGTAQSFSIRGSRITVGWRDELVPEDVDLDDLSDHSQTLLAMNRKVCGFFSPSGTCKHIKERRKEMENAYWREIQPLVRRILSEEMSESEVEAEATAGALRAFSRISNNRDTINIDRHLRAQRLIAGFFSSRKKEAASV